MSSGDALGGEKEDERESDGERALDRSSRLLLTLTRRKKTSSSLFSPEINQPTPVLDPRLLRVPAAGAAPWRRRQEKVST